MSGLSKIYTTIVASGSYVPERIVRNDDFLQHEFFDPKTNEKFDRTNEDIIEKFYEITNISERRWASEDQTTSDLAAAAALDALTSSGIDPESLGFIIVGHNTGDIEHEVQHSRLIPSVAARTKALLHIKNPECVAFDVLAGCPAWTQAMITADMYIKSGLYKRGLVIGADITSRVGDPHDRDCMIFADGAGAVIVEATESEEPVGIVSFSSRTDSVNFIQILDQKGSLNPDFDQSKRYIRMLGNKVYVYALKYVPNVVKDSLEKAGLTLDDISKVLIHQANEKMDDAILERVFDLYKKEHVDGIMPMTIRKLGNTSAATVPTMFDLIMKGKIEEHVINPNDTIIFTSVGAGMNINSIVYKMPSKSFIK